MMLMKKLTRQSGNNCSIEMCLVVFPVESKSAFQFNEIALLKIAADPDWIDKRQKKRPRSRTIMCLTERDWF
jgi:hypothetical protein